MPSIISRYWRELVDHRGVSLGDLACVDATEPLRLFHEETAKHLWDDNDFTWVSPFKTVWIEALPPQFSMKNGIEIPWQKDLRRLGWLVESKSVDESMIPFGPAASFAIRGQLLDTEIRDLDKDGNVVPLTEKPKWVQQYTCFLDYGHKVGTVTRICDFITAEGKIASQRRAYVLEVEDEITRERRKQLDAIASERSLDLGYILSLLHCKNVTLSDRLPLPKKSKPGDPRFRFKVLDIAPMREIVRTAKAAGDADPVKRALHMCRGHFSTYSPDAPLFGKHTGTFWIPQHARGSIERGAVQRDYRIKTP